MTEGSWEPTPEQRVKILTDQTNALLDLVQRLTKAADKDAERIIKLEKRIAALETEFGLLPMKYKYND